MIGWGKGNRVPLDDLPGLDDDEELPEPNEPAADAPATEPPANEPLASTETESPQWTTEELDDWWEHDFGGSESFVGDVPFEPHSAIDAVVMNSLDPDFIEAYQALLNISVKGATWSSAFMAEGWDRLSHEMKEKFRSGWEAAMAPQANPEPDPESVMPELAPYGSAYDGPVGLVGGSVVDEIAPYPLSDGHTIDSEATSPAPGRFKWLWLVVPVVGAALAVGLFVLTSGSDGDPSTPSASVDVPTDVPITEAAVDDPSDAAGAAAPVTETVGDGSFLPLEDHGPCHFTDEDCPGHLVLGVNQTAVSIFPNGIVVLDMTQTVKGDVPTNPELPTEYRLVVESTNGPQIEKVLSSSGGGEPFTCVLRLNGVETAPPDTAECGIAGADDIHITIDISPLSAWVDDVSWDFYTEETQSDGTLLGDQLAGGGDENP